MITPSPAPTPRPPQWYGWRPDSPDLRDHWYQAKLSRLAPSSVDLRSSPYLSSAWDQGDLGCCVGNSTGKAYQFAQRKQGYTDYMPSRLFVYYNARVIEGSVSVDDGCEPRDAIKVLARQGAPHETLWQYEPLRFSIKPSDAAYADGLKHNAISYKRVSVDDTSVKAALQQGLPVVVGFMAYESFEGDEVAKTGVYAIPGANEKPIGGHSVLCVGYEKLGRTIYGIFMNSWATDWGNHGCFVHPLHFFCQPGYASDFWVIETVEA